MPLSRERRRRKLAQLLPSTFRASSIREYVEKKIGVRPYNYDGYQNSQWIVLDYGTIYAHIFLPEFRNRYNLEQLWNDAPITTIPDLD